MGERYGGRQKGTKNKKTVAREMALQKAINSGISPLEYLLSIMRDESKPEQLRMTAAGQAAPYMHPRLASMDLGQKPGSEPLHIKVTFVNPQGNAALP